MSYTSVGFLEDIVAGATAAAQRAQAAALNPEQAEFLWGIKCSTVSDCARQSEMAQEPYVCCALSRRVGHVISGPTGEDVVRWYPAGQKICMSAGRCQDQALSPKALCAKHGGTWLVDSSLPDGGKCRLTKDEADCFSQGGKLINGVCVKDEKGYVPPVVAPPTVPSGNIIVSPRGTTEAAPSTVSAAPVSTRATAVAPSESNKIAGLTPLAWVGVAVGVGALAYLIGRRD